MPWVMKEPKSLFLTEDSLGIVTDLYQLTMAAGYFEQKMHDIATFELFVRNLPKNRSYLIVAGLEQVLHYLTHITFSPEIVQFLRRLPIFNHVGQEFFEYLKNFTFRGDVYAIPEGTIAFADEPMLRVTAPIIETQLVETYLLSMINFQTYASSLCPRCAGLKHGSRGRCFQARGPPAPGPRAACECQPGGQRHTRIP